ncbi:MAG: 1-deoxy-D-xylulose-5-phosphate synthase, partial [Lachnospiraceae bacterium]|nr:1-deoxy-D-xylulose-5-phosphate synthase [Lachnospiraceae bacterium]
NAAKLSSNYIIVLNDNNMSISENVGGISNYLSGIRTSEGYLNLRDKVFYSLNEKSPRTATGIRRFKNTLKSIIVPGMFFEEMGITYLGPVDGHNIPQLLKALKAARRIRKAVLLHVVTEKGKGYEPAVRHPARFHGTSPFEIETGLPKNHGSKAGYSDIFSTVMVKLGARNKKVVAITAAMSDGTGLKRFRNIYPERFFDVGIAEQHAVTFAAGLASGGLRPVFAVYSTFLQRAYDQILHDVCLQNLPVVFAIDRAGIVGADGETHQGVFDLSYLSSIPNMTIMAPKNKWELSDMMKFAVEHDGPVAVRYPRGEAYDGLQAHREAIEYGKAEVIFEEEEILLLPVGIMVSVAEQVRDALKEKGHRVSLVNMRFVKPFDKELIKRLAPSHKLVVTMEDNVLSGGFGEHVAAFLEEERQNTPVLSIAVPDAFVTHGSPAQLYAALGMDADSVTQRILQALGENA